MAFVNFYEILEVAPTATAEEIQQAVRAQRRVWVRRQSSPDPERRTTAEQRVRQIDEAEKTLLSAAARAAFDRQLQQRTELPSPVEPPGSPTGQGNRNQRPRTREHAPRSDEPSAPTETSTEWVRRGRDYLDQGNHGAAYRAARRATGLDPHEVTGWLLAGDAAMADERLDEAEDAYAEAVRLRSNDVDAHAGLGEVFLANRDWPRAQRELEAVVERAPERLQARLSLAQVLVLNGQHDDGLAWLSELVDQHPDHEQVRSAYARAIYDATLARLDRLDDGLFIPNSRRQVSLVGAAARQIHELGSDHPDAAQCEQELKRLHREATKATWSRSHRKRVYALPLLLGLVMIFTQSDIATQIIGGVILLLAVAVFLLRHRKPMWKVRRAQLAPRVVQKGV